MSNNDGIHRVLEELGIKEENPGVSTGKIWIDSPGSYYESISPVDGKLIAKVEMPGDKEFDQIVQKAGEAFDMWKLVPAPKRGEIVRQIGARLRTFKEPLGKLVTYEMGKSYQEGLGEVQEMIDICDFAVGLSRQLYGLSMHSEREKHRMYEQYHPLGIVGVISAFNFPVAVWAWNAMIAWVCGDVVIWKPSEKVPLCALACQKIVADVMEDNNLPEGICNLIVGDYQIGQRMAQDKRLSLISATGSTRMGKSVGEAVGARLGKAYSNWVETTL